METLANLESFVRSAEAHSFSAAARRLSLSPAAVSRNVAMLERNLGVRLFQRSTRRLTLTAAGDQLLAAIAGNLDALQGSLAAVSADGGEPAGPLKVSLAPSIGTDVILPLLPAFLARYPLIQPDWRFENRTVDLIAEGYDAAIGGGFEVSPGLVARELAPMHLVVVAAPALFADRTPPETPDELAALPGIVRRSGRSGRVREWTLRNAAGEEASAPFAPTLVFDDPTAIRAATLLGLGVSLLVMSDVLPWLERGELVRLLPHWYVDAGAISIYYPTRSLMPARSRVFIDFVTEAFERQQLARRFSGLAR